MAHRSPTFTPWLRRDQWDAFRQVYAEPGQLHASYDDWLRDAQGGFIALAQAGYQVHRVDVDLTQLVSWCRHHGRPLDALALMHFACERGAC